ncbi:MAG: hypothetical protein AAF623_10805 [Planctomycetota bacterium]
MAQKSTSKAAKTKVAKSRSTKATKKKTTKKKAVKKVVRKAKSESVDGILKRYELQRKTSETKLIHCQKKIAELLAKTKAFQKQITQLTREEVDTQKIISQLDEKRDAEVSKLLKKLGVNVTDPKPIKKPVDDQQKPTLFAESESDDGDGKKKVKEPQSASKNSPQETPIKVDA